MAELTDTLSQLLEGQTGQISQRIGADEAQTRSAVQAAIPALLAAFTGEAERGGGLSQAVQRDHDGSILDQLSDYLGGTAQLSPRTTNGAGILDHVLGDRQSEMQRALSAKTGLDMGSIANLLALLAPVLMGMLGKQSGSSGRGIDLGNILKRETDANRSSSPDIGDILDSFAKGGGSKGGIGDVLGGLFGGKG